MAVKNRTTPPSGPQETTEGGVPLAANTEELSVPEVEAERTSEPEAATVSKTVPMVRYKDGQHFEVRTITLGDWAKAGVTEGAKLLHWYPGNGFLVPKSELDFLTDEQFVSLILADPRFEVVE